MSIVHGNCLRLSSISCCPHCQQATALRPKFRFKNKLLLLDATLIDLCVTMFDWARFRTTKGAIKLHLLLDHDG